MPPLVPAMIDHSIILNLGFKFDCPLSVPEKENNPLGIKLENENIGNVIIAVNTDFSELVLVIKNPFCGFLVSFSR